MKSITKQDRATLQRKVAQLREALGNDNRWYFCIRYKRQPISDEELIWYYINNGGPEDYAKRNANATIQESN